MMYFRSIWLSFFYLVGVAAFTGPLKSTRQDSALCCICIDCKFVTTCKAYHFVESQHEQPHMAENPTFEPRDGSPTIHVNIRTILNREDQERDLQRMWVGQKRTEKDSQLSLQEESDIDSTPMTIYEYDVVSCADFALDKGAWVRNMPEEIRLANPNFVPS